MNNQEQRDPGVDIQYIFLKWSAYSAHQINVSELECSEKKNANFSITCQNPKDTEIKVILSNITRGGKKTTIARKDTIAKTGGGGGLRKALVFQFFQKSHQGT